MNPFKLYRNWRISRIEARIAYLQKYCDMFTPTEGGVPYDVAVFHGIPEKRAKVAQLRKKVYHLMEF